MLPYKNKIGRKWLECMLQSDRVMESITYHRYLDIIENLEWASGGFHDACIQECKLQDDGSLYVKFDGTWGCKVEVWFWGDVEYDISSRDPDECDPYWYGSTVIIWDDFVYFVDEEDMTVDQISDGYCWFKARHMKYRIIPD